jgi:F0F1-type ATP synthase membrane subunit b/b'
MQAQLRRTMAEKKRAIEDLKEKHQEEIERIVKYERANIREYVDKISTSLYEKYREQNKDSFIIDLVKYLLCIK